MARLSITLVALLAFVLALALAVSAEVPDCEEFPPYIQTEIPEEAEGGGGGLRRARTRDDDCFPFCPPGDDHGPKLDCSVLEGQFVGRASPGLSRRRLAAVAHQRC